MIKAILFDFDGPLADTLPLYIKAYDGTLKSFGINFSDKKIVDECFGKTQDHICKNLNMPQKTDEFTDLYIAGINKYFDEAQLFNGVIDVLKLAQKKQIKLGIVSFAYRWYVDKMLKQLKINEYFDSVIGFEDVVNPKPDPEAVVTTCKRLNISTPESIVVGDSKSDVLMGSSAGAKTILFHPQDHSLFYDLKKLQTSNPNHTVQNFEEIKKIIF